MALFFRAVNRQWQVALHDLRQSSAIPTSTSAQDSPRKTLALHYCTVTSVPTGISEKNLRAVSSGNRMQPCDAG